MKAKIDKIGIEIEGEFTSDLHSELQLFGGSMKYDGSVRQCSTTHSYHKKFPNQHLGTGEYITQPIKREDKKHFKKVFDLLEEAKKQGRFHWNKSAGFHIHISFNPKIPPEIRSTEFTKFALDKFQNEFPLEYRIRTAGQWCKIDDLNRDSFIAQRSPNRYRAVNYASFAKHGTLEFRIFPSKHPYKMYEYFRFTINMVEEFLNQKEHSFKVETEIEDKKDESATFSQVVMAPKDKTLVINQ